MILEENKLISVILLALQNYASCLLPSPSSIARWIASGISSQDFFFFFIPIHRESANLLIQLV